MPTFYCSAILFDLDGVLVDSTRSVTRQWRIWAKDNGIDPEKLLEIAHGRRTAETVRLLAPHLAAEEEARMLETREAADTDGVTVMPGAAALLQAIPAGCWCVVTSGTRHLATSRLRLGRLPIPDVLVTADDVVNGKPDPEPYLKGARLLGMSPEECLVIEDTPAGIEAGHAGGMKVIALPSTYAVATLQAADAVVNTLSQIRVALRGSELQVDVP
ncbi:MAG: HAD family hydrolase [Acidobacteriia bacterium]|nr:HAD family hydrolase [Terriglobia bacterium]